MINIKRNSGFTLIEILVGINLSFIVISAGVAFYLFSGRFIFSSLKRMQEKYMISTVLNGIETTLNTSDGFTVLTGTGKTNIIVDNKKTMEFSENKITIKNYELSREMDSYILSVIMKTGEEIIIKNGTSNIPDNKEKIILPDEINSISLKVIKAENNYDMEYYTPRVSVKQFRNI